MYWANVDKSEIKLSGKNTIVVGGVNTIYVAFNISDDWDGLSTIVAVFKTPKVILAVDITSSRTVTIPWECCQRVGDEIFIGLYGLDEDGGIVNPTTWTRLGVVVDGVQINNITESEPTKTIFAKILDDIESINGTINDIADAADMMSDAIETLEVRTLEHREKIDTNEDNIEFYSHHPNIKDRSEQNQHPIESIDGLSDIIDELEVKIRDVLLPEDLNELLGLGGDSNG